MAGQQKSGGLTARFLRLGPVLLLVLVPAVDSVNAGPASPAPGVGKVNVSATVAVEPESKPAPGVSKTNASPASDIAVLLARLEKGVADINTLKTGFTEEKKLASFRNPAVLKGWICLMKPSLVAWHVLEPTKYTVVITDKVVRQWDEETGKVQELQINRIPVMRTVLEQMRVWFSGRYASLTGDYEVKAVSERPVVLEFLPKESNFVAKVVKRISVGFREDERYLKWIKIEETGGDTSTVTFDNTVLNPALDRRDFTVH